MDNTTELLDLAVINQEDFNCNKKGECDYKERTISYAIGVNIPTPGEAPEEVFKECCYKHFVFGDLNDSKKMKNDFSSFYHQRQLSNESCDFFLYKFEDDTETQIQDDTFGQFFGFGYYAENVDFKGCLIEWRKVLAQLGEGNYKIIKRINSAGVDVEFSSFVFTLQNYSSLRANNTVRLDVVMNGRLLKQNVNFEGLSWKNSIRVPGFFGSREFQIEKDNLIDRDFKSNQISLTQSNEYKYQTNLIPQCITNEIIDFFLFGNDIFVTDYNLNNHSYDFVHFPIEIESNEGTNYPVTSRKARLNLVFTDKYKNNIKRNF